MSLPGNHAFTASWYFNAHARSGANSFAISRSGGGSHSTIAQNRGFFDSRHGSYAPELTLVSGASLVEADEESVTVTPP